MTDEITYEHGIVKATINKEEQRLTTNGSGAELSWGYDTSGILSCGRRPQGVKPAVFIAHLNAAERALQENQLALSVE